MKWIEDRSIPEPNSGCWLWLRVTARGYGRTKYAGKHWLAHRLAWTLANGDIPAGMHVCHRCDVPLCVNPSHLFIGTHATNMVDRNKKGRVATGERSGMSRLTAASVMDIRALLNHGASRRALARLYGVGRTAIDNIGNGATWKQVSTNTTMVGVECRENPRTRDR